MLELQQHAMHELQQHAKLQPVSSPCNSSYNNKIHPYVSRGGGFSPVRSVFGQEPEQLVPPPEHQSLMNGAAAKTNGVRPSFSRSMRGLWPGDLAGGGRTSTV